MEQNVNKVEPKLYYSEKVDVTFQTYLKSINDCIASLCEPLKIASSFGDPLKTDLEVINLINMLATQKTAVDKFLSEYSKLRESV